MAQVLQVFYADELLDTILLIIIFAVLLGVVARMYVRRKRRKMAQGLQVFNADGNAIFDSSTHTCRLLGSVTIKRVVDSKTGRPISGYEGEIEIPLGKGERLFIIKTTVAIYNRNGVKIHLGDRMYSDDTCFYVSENKIVYTTPTYSGYSSLTTEYKVYYGVY